MLRADNCICGTSTTGTGTLTLAACPSGLGAIDPYIAFSTQGFGTSVAIPGTWTITEYTDSTFSQPKQIEKVIGSLLLGASIGACTLARTTVQYTQTGLNTSTPSYTIGGSPITIGTAANVLVAIDVSSRDVPSAVPYYDTTVTTMAGVHGVYSALPQIINTTNLTSGTEYWGCIETRVPVVAAVMRMVLASNLTGSTTGALYGRLYYQGTDGRPGSLLADYGAIGNNLLNNGSVMASAALATPPLLLPGVYWCSYYATWSDGTGSVALRSAFYVIPGNSLAKNYPIAFCVSTSTGPTNPAPTTANLTGWFPNYNSAAALFGLAPS